MSYIAQTPVSSLVFPNTCIYMYDNIVDVDMLENLIYRCSIKINSFAKLIIMFISTWNTEHEIVVSNIMKLLIGELYVQMNKYEANLWRIQYRQNAKLLDFV